MKDEREDRRLCVMTGANECARYLVDEVLQVRSRRKKLEYLVKWEGYEETTWEPLENLLDQHGRELAPLRAFKARVGMVGGGRV